jgi:type VI secretion system protein ImpC
MNIELNIGSGNLPEKSREQSAANILIVANFSGKPGENNPAHGDGAILNMFNVDAGDLDAALARVAPQLSLNVGDQELSLSFSSLEDFHPDTLFGRQPVFSTISDLKQSLNDPSKAAASIPICKELLGWSELPESVSEPESPPSADSSSEDLFTRLLGKSANRATSSDPAVQSAVQRILNEATGDEAVAQDRPEIASLRDGLDALSDSAMRELLHHPEFQALEASWRSTQWLEERLEFGAELLLWMVDVGSAAADVWAPQLASRALQALDSVDLLIVLDEFSDTPESLRQLETLSENAKNMGTEVVAAAAPALAGLADRPDSALALDGSDVGAAESEAWQAVRASASATSVMLGFPRFMLRQPYGQQSDPIDAVDFEELEAAPDHESFLWASPAIALAVMSLQQTLRVEDLPMVVYDDGGGQAIKPTSEVYLTDSAGEKLLQRGIIALMGRRGHTDIRILRFQSIAR